MLSILRMVAALLFILHGTQKLFSWPTPAQPGPPIDLITQRGIAGILEAFGGIAILLGIFTRPVAFLLAGEMAVAYFQVHFPRSMYPINNGGDNAVLFCFIFLYLMVAGAGTWSIDHMIASNRFDDSRIR
jgi:putative oxidoreductase